MDLCRPEITDCDAITEIKRVNPQTKIIVLTLPRDEDYILSTLQVGVNGYVSKKCESTELLTAIYDVLDGRYYVSPSISAAITDCLLRRKKPYVILSDQEILSQREMEIVKADCGRSQE